MNQPRFKSVGEIGLHLCFVPYLLAVSRHGHTKKQHAYEMLQYHRIICSARDVPTQQKHTAKKTRKSVCVFVPHYKSTQQTSLWMSSLAFRVVDREDGVWSSSTRRRRTPCTSSWSTGRRRHWTGLRPCRRPSLSPSYRRPCSTNSWNKTRAKVVDYRITSMGVNCGEWRFRKPGTY